MVRAADISAAAAAWDAILIENTATQLQCCNRPAAPPPKKKKKKKTEKSNLPEYYTVNNSPTINSSQILRPAQLFMAKHIFVPFTSNLTVGPLAGIASCSRLVC